MHSNMGAYSESLLLSHFWEPFSVGAIQPMQMGASRNYLSPTELLQPEDPVHFFLCFLLCSSKSINRTIHYWVNEVRRKPQSLKDPVQKTATVYMYSDFNEFLT